MKHVTIAMLLLAACGITACGIGQGRTASSSAAPPDASSRSSATAVDAGDNAAQPKPAPDYSNFQARLLTLHNQARDRAGAGPLTIDPTLAQVAQDYAAYLDRTNRWGHFADGANPAKRVAAAGYSWRAVAENVGDSKGLSLERLFDEWMQSSIHRGNLLNPRYTDVGFGHAGHKWIVVFAKPK